MIQNRGSKSFFCPVLNSIDQTGFGSSLFKKGLVDRPKSLVDQKTWSTKNLGRPKILVDQISRPKILVDQGPFGRPNFFFGMNI